jgi:hypothetical protein
MRYIVTVLLALVVVEHAPAQFAQPYCPTPQYQGRFDISIGAQRGAYNGFPQIPQNYGAPQGYYPQPQPFGFPQSYGCNGGQYSGPRLYEFPPAYGGYPFGNANGPGSYYAPGPLAQYGGYSGGANR